MDQVTLLIGAFAREGIRRGHQKQITLAHLSILIEVYRDDSTVVHSAAGSSLLPILRQLDWVQLAADPQHLGRVIVQRTAHGDAVVATPIRGAVDGGGNRETAARRGP